MSKRSRQHRAAQARRNGAQSQGRVTAQGKAVSALNAVSHALSSRKPLLLHDENRADYDDIRRDYHLQFLPHNAVELDLVDLRVHPIWQLRRGQTAQTATRPAARPIQFPSAPPITRFSYRSDPGGEAS